MKNQMIRKVIAGFITGVSLCTFVFGTNITNAAVNEKIGAVELTKNNVQQFADEYFSEKMEQYGVPGIGIAVVKDGKELMASSYGVTNVETQEKVTSDTTFPACSVSKLFTATAIMQLYDQGKIDLDEDISVYLPDVKINNPYEKKITCSQLLTHSSGLDEQSELAGSSLSVDGIKSPEEYFETQVLRVIREPGTVSCYSNMGYNILGYIVEKVSGESYEDYVQQHILTPLNMGQTSVRIGDENIADGYICENGVYEKQNLAYQYTSGSSGIIATVKDMEQFMNMNLNLEKNNGIEILKPETLQLMQQKQFANHDIFDGMGYGWIRTNYGNVDVIKHEGALPGYTTTMFLLPQYHIGVYIAANSMTGICFDFEDAFMRYFFGENAVEGATECGNFDNVKRDNADMSVYAGTYRNYDGISRKNLMKLGILFDQTDMQVKKIDDDMLEIRYYNQKKECVETKLKYCGNGVFARNDGEGYIVFSTKNESNKTMYAFTQVSHCAYEKIALYEEKEVLFAAMSALIIMFIISIIFLIRLMRKKYITKKQKAYHTLVMISQFTMVISTIISIALVMEMIYSYEYSALTVLRILLAVQMVAAVFMFAGSAYGIYNVIVTKMSKKTMICVCGVLTVQIVSVLVLRYFNLLGNHIF